MPCFKETLEHIKFFRAGKSVFISSMKGLATAFGVKALLAIVLPIIFIF